MDQITTTPPATTMDRAATATTSDQAITWEAIQAARFEFLRRAHRAFHIIAKKGYDPKIADFEPPVIARNVTIAQLQTVPKRAFDGIQVALLTDGSLVVTDVYDVTNMDDMALCMGSLVDYMAGEYDDV